MFDAVRAKLFGDAEDPRERLRDIFGGDLPQSGQPPYPALMWAEEVRAQTPDSRSDSMKLTRALRQAEPRLTLRSATFLAQHTLGQAEDSE